MGVKKPDDTGTESSSRIARMRKWLFSIIVAAVGAVLLELATGAITGGVSTLWERINPQSPVYISITKTDLVRVSKASAHVALKPPSQIPAVPRKEGPARDQWWAELKDSLVDAEGTNLDIHVTGKDESPVIITGIQLRVISRDNPLNGTYLECGQGDGVEGRYLEFDLDSGQLTASDDNTRDNVSTPINFPYRVSASSSESFFVAAVTQKYHVKWFLELGFVHKDKKGVIKIDDNGQPFENTSTYSLPYVEAC
jgi:hypothetical protein